MSSLAQTMSRKLDSSALDAVRARGRLLTLLGVIVVWVVIWAVTRGTHTLEIGGAQLTDAHNWFADRAHSVQDAAAVGTNPFFVATNSMADGLNAVITWLRNLFTVPAFPRPLPQVGWFGIVAIASWVTFAIAGWRSLLLVIPTFLIFGFLGLWNDSIDLLIITFVSVLFSVVIGIPIAIWMAHSKIVTAIVTPVLDVMQTMPSFSYLLPVTIIFNIGATAAVVVIFIYASPPVIRITAHGIRSLSASTLEATDSLGQTWWQRLKSVELPMAKKTIIVGVNQTIMAALAMAIIAGYINSPGLGQNVLSALIALQFGQATVAGLAIVLMAIMLDRTLTAASERSERVNRSASVNPMWRRAGLVGGGIATLVAIWLSNTRTNFNQFPTSPDLGTPIARRVDDFGNWLLTNLSGLTTSIQEKFTVYFLNPMQDLIANSPWYVTGAAILAIAAIVGGWRAFVTSVVCLAGIYVTDLWNYAMVTLTSVLVATVVVMILAAIFGVWMGRSKMADRAIRPLLDAAQTIPSMVYLIPILILFGPNRFTAIIAGVIYALPPATKLIADGVRGVNPTTIEAAESSGTSRWQMITKVQLPMAKGSLVLAANQGLLYVLSMVVIGGIVGAGGLGGDIVRGFRQGPYVGRGLAAAVAIVLLGIMLDRITRYGAEQRPGKAVGTGRTASATA